MTFNSGRDEVSVNGKTFEEYGAEYARAPFPWPMPGGASVPVPQASFDTTRKAVAAATAGNLMDAVAVYAGAEAGAQIAAAWGPLPTTAVNAVFEDMRKHFGAKNS
jgi:hypothetical protein